MLPAYPQHVGFSVRLPLSYWARIIQRSLRSVNSLVTSSGAGIFRVEEIRSEAGLPARKLLVSTYLQYIALAVVVVLLVSFVRQVSGVLLTFLAAGVLAYTLNPIVRRLESLRIPRTIAVIGVFVVLIFVVVVTLLLIIVPSVGQEQDRILQLLKENAPSAEQVANVATGVIGGVFGVFGTIFNLLLMVLISV